MLVLCLPFPLSVRSLAHCMYLRLLVVFLINDSCILNGIQLSGCKCRSIAAFVGCNMLFACSRTWLVPAAVDDLNFVHITSMRSLSWLSHFRRFPFNAVLGSLLGLNWMANVDHSPLICGRCLMGDAREGYRSIGIMRRGEFNL